MTDDKRGQILAGVWAVIAESGLAAVSVRSVARAAGVSPGLVQHYFPAKTDLIRASVERMLEAAEQAHPQALGDPADPQTLWTVLTHALAPAASARAGMSVYYSYLAASVSDPWIAGTLASAKAGVIDLVTRCLVARADGPADPSRSARELVLLADGAAQAVFQGATSQGEARSVLAEAVRRLAGDTPGHPGPAATSSSPG